MANKVQLKRSAVPGKVPATTDLDLGELAVNTYDGKLYLKKNDGSASIVEIGAGGGGGTGIAWQSVKTSNFTAAGNEAYPVNTTSASITVTLPSSAVAGSAIILTDYAGTWQTNKLLINTNGNKLNGQVATDADVSVSRGSLSLVYIDSTQGWIAYSGYANAPEVAFTFETDYLVVAGGGGGGAGLTASNIGGGGGGGAGGYKTGTLTGLSKGTNYTVTVGGGGSGGVCGGGRSTSGSNSVFSSITSTGGGAGGQYTGTGTPAPAESGGSGGGGGGTGSEAGAAGTSGQGNAGGNGTGYTYVAGYGGGGGASAVGGTGTTSAAGNGGNGSSSSISGSSVTYAGGGGGGKSTSGTAGSGGSGGGGAGAISTSNATNGTVNTGGGGGGGGNTGSSGCGGNGGSGGSGIVIVKYPSSLTISVGAGLTSSETTSGSFKIRTFTAGTGTVSWS
jgi:hypothetical protein